MTKPYMAHIAFFVVAGGVTTKGVLWRQIEEEVIQESLRLMTLALELHKTNK